MLDQNWDDDSDHHQAVGHARVTVAPASRCSLVAIGLVAVAVFGVGIFVALVKAFSG
ncbi:hypothetical protein [Streptomyces viridochromogenes]|uniref:hypothetical protein n=1 Tax=Streptomyces viridochromogenes TaxID=1938 RepID=UPI0015C4E851|nr:hypothetical protein [Streptomyces viridochromogenes]